MIFLSIIRNTDGSVTLVNFYDIEYHGEYSVSGLEVSLRMDQVWIGRFHADNRIAGTWMDSNGVTSGEWEAKR